jgi:hypothetical protein
VAKVYGVLFNASKPDLKGHGLGVEAAKELIKTQPGYSSALYERTEADTKGKDGKQTNNVDEGRIHNG